MEVIAKIKQGYRFLEHPVCPGGITSRTRGVYPPKANATTPPISSPSPFSLASPSFPSPSVSFPSLALSILPSLGYCPSANSARGSRTRCKLPQQDRRKRILTQLGLRVSKRTSWQRLSASPPTFPMTQNVSFSLGVDAHDNIQGFCHGFGADVD